MRYRLKLSYPEEDLVRVDEVFWLNNNYEMPITEIDHRTDQVSDKNIKKFEDDGHLVNTDSDNQDRFKNMPGSISTLQRKGE